MTKLLYAHTETVPPVAPAFINISEMDDGAVVVTVRHRGQSNPSAIRLPKEDWDKLREVLSTKATEIERLEKLLWLAVKAGGGTVVTEPDEYDRNRSFIIEKGRVIAAEKVPF